MNYLLNIMIVMILTIFFTACGGGDSSSQPTTQSTTLSGVAQLGYVKDAKVSLYALDDLNTSIAETRTSSSTDLEQAGSFSFTNLNLETDEYYLLKISAGKDIDANDDGIVDTTFTDLNGSVHALVKGSELASTTIRVNAISDMVFQKMKDSLSTASTKEIEDDLAKNAQEYLYDIDGDGSVTNKDIVLFNPLTDAAKSKKSYRDIVNVYVPKLHTNADDTIKFSSVIYINPPQIEIENGTMQVVPFNLKASITNIPDDMKIQWTLNDVNKTNINETITEDGIYTIKAFLYKDSTYITSVSKSVIATSEKELSSLDINVSKENKIFVTHDSNSSLAGTEITIPQDALQTSKKISVKSSSLNMIPAQDGVSISDVLVMEPSGLQFDKPVTIRMPYNADLNTDISNIKIARYNDGGIIDYIEPLYVDTKTHEVVFETEHFTKFEAKTTYPVLSLGKYIPFKDTKDEEFIKTLNTLFPEYENDMNTWAKILNVFIDQENKKLTIYDLLRTYIENRNMYEIIQGTSSNKHIEAIYALYPDVIEANRNMQVWNEVNLGFQTISLIESAKTSVENITSGAIYKDLLRNLGIPITSDDLLAESTPTPETIIQVWNKNIDGVYVRQFFNSREEVYYDGYFDYTLGNSLGVAIDWLRNKQLLWATESLVRRYETFDPTRDYNSAKSAIQSAIDYLKFEEERNAAKDDQHISFKSVPNKIFYKESEKIEVSYTMSMYGYDSGESLKFDIYGIKGTELVHLVDRDEVKSYCSIDDNINSLQRECSGTFTLDTSLVQDLNLIKVVAFEDKLGPDKNLQTDAYLHLYHTQKVAIEDISHKTAYITDYIVPELRVTIDAAFVGNQDIPFLISVANCSNYGLCSSDNVHDNILSFSKTKFDYYDLSDVEVVIEPKSKQYDFEPQVIHLNLKQEYDDFLSANSSDNSDTTSESSTTTTPSVVVPVLNQITTGEITTGEDIDFSFDKTAVDQILRVSDFCYIPSSSATTLRCSYSVAGVYSPYIKVLMNDGEIQMIEPENKVYVFAQTASSSDLISNSAPIASDIYITATEDTPQSISVNYKDLENDSVEAYVLQSPEHGDVIINGTSFQYTPSRGYVGRDSFTYYVKDALHESNTARVTIDVKEKVIPKYIEYLSESDPKDGTYIKKGASFTKTWYFSNPSGNKPITNMQVFVDRSCGFSLTKKTTFPAIIASGTTFNFTYDVTIPQTADNGVCTVSFHLEDNDGNLLYANGSIASTWMELEIVDALPSSLTLEPVADGVEGETFVFKATVSPALSSEYSLKLSLGDGGGGWLAASDMVANQDRTLFAKAVGISKAGIRKYRVAFFKGTIQMSDWQEGTYVVKIVDSSNEESETEDADTQEPIANDKYTTNLAGKTFYMESPHNTLSFSADLTSITIRSLDEESMPVSYTTELDNNGLHLNDTNYYILKELTDTYILMEKAQLTSDGVYLSHDGEFKLYYSDPLISNTELNATKILVGNTFYQYCQDSNELFSLSFGSDYVLRIPDESVSYKIDNNTIVFTIDSKEESHTLISATDSMIAFGTTVDDIFYTTEADAKAHPANCSGEDLQDSDNDYIEVNYLISGHVTFEDLASVPSDAYVGVVPSRYQNDASGWNRLICKIDSTGNFGSECYIDHDETGMRTAFEDNSETFQVVVFKNHIEPSEYNWNCGEDLYAYIGSNEANGAWSSLIVKDEDYQDRSDEVCTQTAIGSVEYLGNSFDIFKVSSYMSDMPNNEVQIFLLSGDIIADGSLQFTISNSRFSTNIDLKNALLNGDVYLSKEDMIENGVQFFKDGYFTGVDFTSGSIKLHWLGNDQYSIDQNGAELLIANDPLTFTTMIVQWSDENHNSNEDIQEEYFVGDFMNSANCQISNTDIVFRGNNGTLYGWHEEDYPLQLFIVLNEDFTALKCLYYDFHKYYDDGEMGSGQSGTDEGTPEKSIILGDDMQLYGSYSFKFEGNFVGDNVFQGTWYQVGDDKNGNYTDSGGFSIPLEEVKTSLDEEVVKNLLAGKTFYSVDVDDKTLIKIEFNTDATSFIETDISTGNSDIKNIKIEGDRWYDLDSKDGSYTIVSQFDEYIYFDDRLIDASKDGAGHRLYIDERDAQDYLDSLEIDETVTKFTKDYLNGKRFYFVQYDDFGYDGEDEPGMQWNMARMDFTENTVSWTEIDLPDSSTHTFTYTITENGDININEEHLGVITFENKTEDYLQVCQDGDCNTYLFFDEDKARLFRDQKNGY